MQLSQRLCDHVLEKCSLGHGNCAHCNCAFYPGWAKHSLSCLQGLLAFKACNVTQLGSKERTRTSFAIFRWLGASFCVSMSGV